MPSAVPVGKITWCSEEGGGADSSRASVLRTET